MADSEPLRIDVDGSGWANVLDFYRAVLGVLEAPNWHGYGPDALNDSMVFGGINGLAPPYDLVISGLRADEIAREINLVRNVLAVGRADFRAEHGCDVNVSIRLEGQPPVRCADEGDNDEAAQP